MRIIRLKDVMATTGLGRSSIYKYAHEGTFPKPVSLGGRSSGWVLDEVEEWVIEKIAQRDEKLEEERKERGGVVRAVESSDGNSGSVTYQ